MPHMAAAAGTELGNPRRLDLAARQRSWRKEASFRRSGGTLDALRYVVRAGYFTDPSAWRPGCVGAARQPAGLKSVGAVGGGGVMLVWARKADRDASGLARAAEIVAGPGSGGGRGEPCPGVVHANSPAGWPGCGFAERRRHFAE